MIFFNTWAEFGVSEVAVTEEFSVKVETHERSILSFTTHHSDAVRHLESCSVESTLCSRRILCDAH